MSSSSLSLADQLHVNAVVFRIRAELLNDPMLTDVHLRDRSGAVVKRVTVSTAANAPRQQRRLSRADTQTLTESTTSLDRLGRFYSRFLPEVSVMMNDDDAVVASQSQVESAPSQSVVVQSMAIGHEQQEEKAVIQPQEDAEHKEEQESRYPKRARQPVQQEQKYNASPANKQKKRATVSSQGALQDTDFDYNKAQVKRYYRLFTKVYKTKISDDISWVDLLNKIEATAAKDGADDATYRALATDLTGQRDYHHTFKMITYYLRGVLAINLKQRYQGKGYQEMAKKLLDIHSPEDISAYPQFSTLMKKYYPKEIENGDGLVYMTALKAEIPWREWRVKSKRKLIEIALRRFYKKKHNEREVDEYEYSESELPVESKDNKDIYVDEDDDDGQEDDDDDEEDGEETDEEDDDEDDDKEEEQNEDEDEENDE